HAEAAIPKANGGTVRVMVRLRRPEYRVRGDDDVTADQGSDLSTPSLPLMTLTPDLATTYLATIFGWVGRGDTLAIAWYMKEKEQMARRSRLLRAFALILAALGGAVPVVALAAHRTDLGNWGYPLLALSAGAVAYDRFFGYSSAWQRYLVTATAL